jgi:hypothetical protein
MTRKEALWLACKAKACCHAATIVPTGRDIWRIARALDAPPWSFLVPFEAPQPRRDAFALDQSARRFRLALAKGATRRVKSPPPCIFLLRTRTGQHRCGLGDLRPQLCKAFPTQLVDGLVCVLPDTGCTCRAWALADLDVNEERAAAEMVQAESEEYCALVAQWNARVAAAPPGTQLSVADYCAFVLAAYEAFAAEAASPAAESPAGGDGAGGRGQAQGSARMPAHVPAQVDGAAGKQGHAHAG